LVKLQNAAVAEFKSVPHGIDSNTYFAPKIPAEVKDAVPLLYSTPAPIFEKLVGACVTCLKNNNFSEDEFRALIQDIGAEEEKYSIIFSAILMMIGVAVRNRTKASIVQKDLKEINVPDEFVVSLVAALKENRKTLEALSIDHRTRFPRLDGLEWRVDVTISSSSLLRVFRPSITMQMALSDGRIKTFEVSVDQFHQLRYNVAKVLRDMQELERHPIMRIAFEAEKKEFDES